MKQLAIPAALPTLVGALDRALSPVGVSSLDPEVPAAVWRRALSGPAADFLARPGKELRTTIVRAGWVLGGGAPNAMPDRLPLVIELLHAGSLIIDDVEDDSDERRGAPTLHRIIGAPLAINTGSWMYFWALAELAEIAPAALPMAASTLVRCHQGQALDLSVRIAELDVADVPAVVAATTRLKTGALCTFAAELGALAAGASDETRVAIGRFALAMGTGLQMLDDLGSITAPERREKGREDLRAGRPTWPWAWLAEQGPFAWARFASMARPVDTARIDELADALSDATATIGRARVSALLANALTELRDAVGASAALDTIAAELRRMEASYG
ncbi:MAG: polyprenyl synthetase family protein [Kofleriaceae bacterium]